MTDDDHDVDVDADEDVLEELADKIADARDHMWCGEVDSAKRRLEETPDTGCGICEDWVAGLQAGLLFALSGHPEHNKDRLDAVGKEAHRMYKVLRDAAETEAAA